MVRAPRQLLFRNLLSALAGLNGRYGLSSVLEALDCEVECPDCGSSVDPMASNLNLLWRAGAGEG